MHPVRANWKFSMSFPPSLGCFERANPSTSSFYLFLSGAILNSVASGGITQRCWENGLFQANSSQPAACE